MAGRTEVLTARPGVSQPSGSVRRWSSRYFPEVRALRILFYDGGTKLAYPLFWGVTTGLFLLLMTYRSLRPLDPSGVLVAAAFGGLLPLTLLLGYRANRVAKCCHRPKTTRFSTGTAAFLSLLATIASCMCCLPLVPMVLGLLLAGTAFATQAVALSVAVAAWAPWLYVASAALLLWSMRRNSRALIAIMELADAVPVSVLAGE